MPLWICFYCTPLHLFFELMYRATLLYILREQKLVALLFWDPETFLHFITCLVDPLASSFSPLLGSSICCLYSCLSTHCHFFLSLSTFHFSLSVGVSHLKLSCISDAAVRTTSAAKPSPGKTIWVWQCRLRNKMGAACGHVSLFIDTIILLCTSNCFKDCLSPVSSQTVVKLAGNCCSISVWVK